MSLLALKDYLMAHKTAHLAELALHFRQDPELVRCKMRHWIQKGKVKVIAKPADCGTRCTLCKPAQAEVYQWNVSI